MKKLFSIFLLLSLGSFTACNKDEKEPFVPSPGIFLLPTEAEVPLGQGQQFEATVQNSGSAIVWAVDGGDANGTVDAGGFYTAPNVLPAQDPIIVRAKLASDATVQATVDVHLVP